MIIQFRNSFTNSGIKKRGVAFIKFKSHLYTAEVRTNFGIIQNQNSYPTLKLKTNSWLSYQFNYIINMACSKDDEDFLVRSGIHQLHKIACNHGIPLFNQDF